MKKIIFYGMLSLMLCCVASCSKKAENLSDLKAKYEGKTFTDCDKFLNAYQEILDVYFASIDKALDGDESAYKDISEFDYFMASFTEDAEVLADQCPEKFEEFGKNLEQSLMNNLSKIMSLYGASGMGDILMEDDGETEEVFEGLEFDDVE